ncbi:assimilatory sulfite reductase (NADPH) flavoprotein subunit [Paraburkholderia sp. BR14320]|uniref:assimilatory sulfite reductase (NADPH) flavoprotein subunit n=1 Tax=unclassified Paraburkholderia TaxID=2615204 RepID=UPI0034D00CCC
MAVAEFRDPGLTEVQWEHIKALTTSLDSRQLVWVSGYLAGFDQANTLRAEASAPAAEARLGGTSARRLTVLYGSETGNSAALARTLAEQAAQRGLVASLHDMASYKVRQLKDEQDVLVVASTYGEGDPPQSATDFFEFVEGRKAPKLNGVRFAVLALGDSTYEHYCEAGKRLDRRFEELGAERLAQRVDCDVDYEQPANAWIEQTLALLGSNLSAGGHPLSAEPRPPAGAVAQRRAAIDRQHPFHARVIENIALTGRGSSKETRHIELSLEGSGLSFEPGDALGVVPTNDPSVVRAVLQELDLDASQAVDVKGNDTTLGDALGAGFEVTALTPRFLEHWARLSGAAELERLVDNAHAGERTAYMRGHHIIDVLRRFPVKGIDAQHFLAALRPLQPRLYSIASSLAAAPDEVHLTVSALRYELHGEPRAGVASGQLSERIELDAQLPVYVHRNSNFRLPGGDVPIIMIGAGTGIAPFRAFMQEREARGANGRSWLFFGERNFRTDFLYQTEWQRLLKDNALTRMDVAFSRDRRINGEGKTYVQHRMQAQGHDLFAWLEEGAHLYVCGDASRLAPDVHHTLLEIIGSEGALDTECAQAYLQQLQRDGRYQRDVY